MPGRQPIGVLLGGVALILAGGFTSLITLFGIIDSIRSHGLPSLLITDPLSMAGFLVYGFTPIFLYFTGVGLFMKREWARQSAVLHIPILLFLFFGNQAAHVAQLVTGSRGNLLELLTLRIDIFLVFFVVYALFFLPMIFYFTRTGIRNYFALEPDSSE